MKGLREMLKMISRVQNVDWMLMIFTSTLVYFISILIPQLIPTFFKVAVLCLNFSILLVFALSHRVEQSWCEEWFKKYKEEAEKNIYLLAERLNEKT
jgi:hypothetical protein